MGSKLYNKNGYLYNARGSQLRQIWSDSDKNKAYAVIAMCGHCGDGYYIPIIFPKCCIDAESAIEAVKVIPKVKRNKKNVILDVFEISTLENMFLELVNDRDPYLKGFFTKDDKELLDRRVVYKESFLEVSKCEKNLSDIELVEIYGIKTADEYYNNQVLQRYFAPVLQGTRLIFPKKVANRQEMMEEYYLQNCLRLGIRKNNVTIISLYYQMYGEDNPLGIHYKNKNFTYKDMHNNIFYFAIPEKHLHKLQEKGFIDGNLPVRKVTEKAETENYKSDYDRGNVALSRFEKRYKKFEQKKAEQRSKKQENYSGDNGTPQPS